ncbi:MULTISPECIES: hypothetical protein [unclassified Gordonia (in: high G+C Gram-positive bacteria)]|uniref:hypothetical protein n=1 Tax=unclassified Gordonia (in: high G+C Gram-positive bacteria) TaxID=2657482 RepID=UPI001F0639D0|nr:hypothetical protein [Gordonia sp. PDNC005]
MRTLVGTRSRNARIAASLLVAVGTAGAIVAPPQANAVPSAEPHYVKTIRCDSANPWPKPRIRLPVDIYTGIRFPSDSLPGPAIELRANQPITGDPWLNITEYTISTRVTWHNLRTGRRGAVVTPTRAHRVTWQTVVHPGAGPVKLSIRQKIGAMAWNPMVNPQFSRCGTTINAW